MFFLLLVSTLLNGVLAYAGFYWYIFMIVLFIWVVLSSDNKEDWEITYWFICYFIGTCFLVLSVFSFKCYYFNYSFLLNDFSFAITDPYTWLIISMLSLCAYLITITIYFFYNN